MPLWKPMLLIVPAGLALGAIGGNLAHPVMQERAGDHAAQAMFRNRADRYALPNSYPDPSQDGLPYVGGYSYAPFEPDPTQGWSPPYDDREWAYSDLPLPRIAELDARQAALLADPDVEFSATPPMAKADPPADSAPSSAETSTADATPAAPVDSGPEPRSADGQLPAIW